MDKYTHSEDSSTPKDSEEAHNSSEDESRFKELDNWIDNFGTPQQKPDKSNPQGNDEIESVEAITITGRFKATTFVLGDTSNIPEREWLYANHLTRKYVSATFAAGGVGKSRLLTGEAVAMASGQNLFGSEVKQPLKVWYWNLEDDITELQRCVSAACKFHGITPEQLGDRLCLDSGRDQRLCTATVLKSSSAIDEDVYKEVTKAIKARGIDVLIIDPFVSSHKVSENDNGSIDSVIKRWGKVAEDTNCAVELVHHTRKEGSAKSTADSARGGGAIIAAVRDARVLNPMSQKDRNRLGVDDDTKAFTLSNAKANFSAGTSEQWYAIKAVNLNNGPDGSEGDSVGVVVSIKPRDLEDAITPEMKGVALERLTVGDCKYDGQANAWAGKKVAEVLGLSLSDPSDKALIIAILKSLEDDGLVQKTHKQETGDRKMCPYYEVCE